ncbi:MAG: threonine--tRNA ligase [Candidatus Nomurabacteria bacterium]|jgi:threonyl-tRNA synthetase|nr:threonine--tRNA ligase [Candidatus Nomurabacteria bacterium]
MEDLQARRHTLAHILALALQTTYGAKVQFGTGPATDTGFYYDVHFDGLDFKIDDLPQLQVEMEKIIQQDLEVKHFTKPIAEALVWVDDAGQPFKAELIRDLAAAGEEEVSFYQIGDFIDLCKGPHIKRTGEIPLGSFALTKIGGAYWRADESREQMTRITGLAFATAEKLADYQAMLNEADKRDHRKLGRELDLFTFSPLVGAGLPLFTPRGAVLRETLGNYSLSLRAAEGFDKVWTPHITKLDLYKKSGHFAKFGDELFMVRSQVNGEEFAMKPMNCPHHAQIYASRPRSYRELPVRYMECTTDYRDEKTGELGGLSRVRSLTQDDSHIFCRQSQIKAEIAKLIGIITELYSTVGMGKLRARLSYRDDSDAYLGDPALWEMSQAQIKDAAIENKLDYFEAAGEAAFYGPKIDFMAEDAIGREHQVATVQLDFVQPARFELEFTNEEGKKEQPVMIHHATLGSIERFLSVFIEHTAGRFPFWCAPEQVRVITVNEAAADYVNQIAEILRGLTLEQPLRHNDLRFSTDSAKDNLSKKIKRAVELKIPAIIVVGSRDAEAGQVVVRTYDTEQTIKLDKLADFLKGIK